MCLKKKSITVKSMIDDEKNDVNDEKDFKCNDLEEKECTLPEGYKILPKKFFHYNDVPSPLVSKSWLKLVEEKLKGIIDKRKKEEEDEEEDVMPLAILRNKLNTKKLNEIEGNQKTNNENNFAKVHCKDDKFSSFLVLRKRGRPKKSEKKAASQNNDLKVTENKEWSETLSWEDSLQTIPKKEQVEDNDVENVKSRLDFRVCKNYELLQYNIIDSVENSLDNKNIDSNYNSDLESGKTGIDKSSFECHECGKSFSALSTLKSHKRIHNGTLLKCQECSKGFTTKYLLKCHMRIHNGDLFMCHECNKGFTTAELLKVHSRGHTGDRPFACNICKRSFSSASNLTQHKQTHSSEKKFLCFQCGSSFRQKRCLDCHMLTHADKSHICLVCGKLWARKSDLVEHMRVHTGAKPYCCSLCPQKFTQASSLKRHQIVHLDTKQIKCFTCGKMFKCQEYYKRHVRKHEKEV